MSLRCRAEIGQGILVAAFSHRETEPGVLRARMRMVIVKQQGDWKILAQQITAVAPAP